MDPSVSAQPTASTALLLDLLRGTPKSDSTTSSMASYTASPDNSMHTASLLNVLHQSVGTEGRSSTDAGNNASTDQSVAPPSNTRVDEASTAELKNVLFGGLGLDGIRSTNDSEVQVSKSQDTNSRTTSALDNALQAIIPQMPSIELAAPTTVEQLERSLSTGSQSTQQQQQQQTTMNVTSTEAIIDQATTPEPEKMSTPIFTYVNPFDLLPKSKRSSPGTSTITPIAIEPFNVNLEPSVQSGYGASPSIFPPPASNVSVIGVDGNDTDDNVNDDEQQIQRHHSPMMVGSFHASPEHTARKTRELHVNNFPKGVPNGVRLPAGDIQIDVASSNLAIMAAHDLEVTTITMIPTDLKFYIGNTVAATKTLIAYAIKDGKFRVIHQLYGTRTLISAHEHAILDMAFFNALQGSDNPQRLVTVGVDHRLCVWQFSEPHPTKRDNGIPCHVILELDGAPALVNEPRFRRAVWHPSNPDVLACAADRSHLLVFNLKVMLSGKDDAHVVEGERNVGAIQLKGHAKPIIDLCFSASGDEIITASEDGTVRLWRISDTEGYCTGVFTPYDGQPVTAVKFVENVIDGHINDTLRCILTATNNNCLVKLFNHDGSQCIQQLEFVHSDSSKQVDFFNVINYDTITKTLVLANSYRESLYCAHVRLDDTPQLVYLIEFPLEYSMVSLALAPDCTEEADTFALCCIQTGAVQQFHVPFRTVLPRRWERCQMIDEPLEESQSAFTSDKGKAPMQLTEAELLQSLIMQPTSSNATDLDTPGLGSAAHIYSPDQSINIDAGGSDAGTRHLDANSSRRSAIEPTRSTSIESYGKGKTPKHSGNGSTKSMSSPGHIPHAALSKAAGKLMETNTMIRDHPAFRSPLLKPRPESNEAETASVTVAQLRSLEDNVVSRMGKLLNKELLKREERWERERQVQLATEISHFEALLSDLAHTLHDTLAHMVVDTIQAEMSERVLPSLERSMAKTMEQSVTTVVNGVVIEQVQKALSMNTLKEPIQRAITAGLQPAMEHTMQSCVRDVMLPAWQQSLESIRSMPTAATSRRPSVHHTPHYTPNPSSHTSSYHEPHPVDRTQTMTNDLKQALMTPRSVFPNQPPAAHYPAAQPQQPQQPQQAQPQPPVPTTPAVANDIYPNRTESNPAVNNLEEAIVKALESKQPAMLELLMQQLNPTAVFPAHQPTTLSQPIVLALLHQLGLDIQQCSLPQQQQRFLWIQNALNHLNVKDNIISEHCSRLLPELEDRVKRAYYAIVAELGVSHPAATVPNAVLRRLNQLVQLSHQLWSNHST